MANELTRVMLLHAMLTRKRLRRGRGRPRFSAVPQNAAERGSQLVEEIAHQVITFKQDLRAKGKLYKRGGRGGADCALEAVLKAREDLGLPTCDQRSVRSFIRDKTRRTLRTWRKKVP